MLCGHSIDDEVHASCCSFHRVGISRQQEATGAHLLRIRLLRRCPRKHDDFRAHGDAELDSHVAQATETVYLGEEEMRTWLKWGACFCEIAGAHVMQARNNGVKEKQSRKRRERGLPRALGRS